MPIDVDDLRPARSKVVEFTLCVVAGVVLVAGLVFALQANDSHERAFPAIGPDSGPGVNNWAIVLENGQRVWFHGRPLPRDDQRAMFDHVITIRYDALDRMVGTTLYGEYVPTTPAPPKQVFFLPLVVGLGLALLAGGYVRGGRRVDDGTDDPAAGGRPLVQPDSNKRGLVTWHSRDALLAERRRLVLAASPLAVVDALFLAALFVIPTSQMLGALFFVVPLSLGLAVIGRRFVHVGRLLRRLESQSLNGSRGEGNEAHLVDSSLAHLAHLVAGIPPGPVREAADDGFVSAERACRAWQRLLDRRNDLTALAALGRDSASSRSIEASRMQCDHQIAAIRQAVQDLAAATATLVESSEDPDLEMRGVRQASQYALLLASSLEELDDPSALVTRDDQPGR